MKTLMMYEYDSSKELSHQIRVVCESGYGEEAKAALSLPDVPYDVWMGFKQLAHTVNDMLGNGLTPEVGMLRVELKHNVKKAYVQFKATMPASANGYDAKVIAEAKISESTALQSSIDALVVALEERREGNLETKSLVAKLERAKKELKLLEDWYLLSEDVDAHWADLAMSAMKAAAPASMTPSLDGYVDAATYEQAHEHEV